MFHLLGDHITCIPRSDPDSGRRAALPGEEKKNIGQPARWRWECTNVVCDYMVELTDNSWKLSSMLYKRRHIEYRLPRMVSISMRSQQGGSSSSSGRDAAAERARVLVIGGGVAGLSAAATVVEFFGRGAGACLIPIDTWSNSSAHMIQRHWDLVPVQPLVLLDKTANCGPEGADLQ